MNPNQTPPGFPPPPVPRDHDRASFSELMPIGSRKISLLRSPLTLIAILAALAVPFMLFSFQQIVGPDGGTIEQRATTFKWFAFAGIFFFVMMLQVAIYFYARPKRSIMPYLWAFLFVFVCTAVPFLFRTYSYLFRELVPLVIPNTGLPALKLAGDNAGFFQTFGTMFFAAGLTEELLKATPMLIGAAIAWAVSRQAPSHGYAPPRQPGAIARFFMIRGPLDGALMGVFAGGGFILAETGLEYVPVAIDKVILASQNPEAVAAGLTPDVALLGGMASALMILLPRVIAGFTGHMGYSALLGYLIGLGVIRRRHFWPIVLIGWVVVSAIHGMWNSLDTLGGTSIPYYVWGALSGLLAVAAILKGRQLDLSMHGDAPDTMGSVVIDRSGAGASHPPAYAPPPPPYYPPQPPQPYPQPGAGYPPPPQPVPPAQGASPTPPADSAAPPPRLDKAPEPPQPAAWPRFEPQQEPHPPTETFAANVAPPPPPPVPDAPPLVLDIAGMIVPIRGGASIDLGSEPALGGRGAGILGEIVPHPTRAGVLGLRNAGERTWTAYLRDGRVQPIAPNQNIRLAAGVRIDFGDGLLADVVARS